MLEKIVILLGLFGFIFWGFGIYEAPEKAPISGWITWMIICLTISLSRLIQKQPYLGWAFYAFGDLVIIILIIYFGGNNWAIRENYIYLSAAFSSLIFFFVYGRNNPKLGELFASISLTIAYEPQIMEWLNYEKIIPLGIILATTISFTNSLLLGIYSYQETGKYGIGNYFSSFNSMILLSILIIW